MNVDPKKYDVKYLAASALLTDRPHYVQSMYFGPHATLVAQYKIYLGSSTAGELLYHVTLSAGIPLFLDFEVPLYFSRGLYVEFASNGSSVTVQYLDENK